LVYFKNCNYLYERFKAMPIIPITINDGHPTGDYSHSWGKFSYGYTNKANFATQPSGLTWVSSLDAAVFAPTGYFIVSDTVTEDGAVSNPKPTFHVTGNTDSQILYMIRRIKSIRENAPSLPDVTQAKKHVLTDAGLNHFDADLTNYRYWNQDSLYLNFDFGNLNCDIKEANVTDLYNLVVPDTSVIGQSFTGFGTIDFTLVSVNKASSYRRFPNGGSYLNLTGDLSQLNVSTVGESFLFAIRLQIVKPTSGVLKLFEATSAFVLSLEQSTNTYKLTTTGGGNPSVSIPLTPDNTWATIIFGKDAAGFLFISDGTNSGTTAAPDTFITLDSGAQLGNISSTSGLVRIASFQYWKGFDGSLDVDAITDVNNEQTLSRWS
jgi:hypothetical protein